MIEIPRLSEFEYVMMNIEPFSELGLPADPSIFRVTMCVSPTRHLGDELPQMFPAQWFTVDTADPPKHYAGLPVGTVTDVGILEVGVWWPFARVETNPEIPLLAGRPFRIT